MTDTAYVADFKDLTLLAKGDNDSRKTWGGAKAAAAASGQPVRSLQRALVAIGTLNFAPDGDFGGRTLDAIRRFQWYLNNLTHRLVVPPDSKETSGRIEDYAATSGIKIDGRADILTLKELAAWVVGGYVTTSPLVRLDLGGLANLVTSGTFKVMAYPSARRTEVLVNGNFVATMGTLNSEAGKASVTLRINQAFRDKAVPPKGAVVPPASKSQHLIGHAIDVNIVDGATVNTSNMFGKGTATEGAKTFIKEVKKLSIRWGGDFSPTDPPHFDDKVPAGSDAYAMAFYFAQRSYSQGHPIRESA